MGEFRIGRKYARHVYPDNPRAAALGLFARNFAVGPLKTVLIADLAGGGTPIPWDAIESGAPSGVHVPITPRITGRIRITGVVTLANVTGAPVDVLVRVLLDDVEQPFPAFEIATVDASIGAEVVPILAELPIPPTLTIGVTRNIGILLVASTNGAVGLILESSSIDIQEVPAATG